MAIKDEIYSVNKFKERFKDWVEGDCIEEKDFLTARFVYSMGFMDGEAHTYNRAKET